MNEMQVAERKVLRGDVIEKLYEHYGTDLRIAVLKSNDKGILRGV